MNAIPEPAICIDCGQKHGRFDPTSISLGTFWIGKCAWCGETKSVTSPSDYGYPTPPEPTLVGDMLDD